LIELLVIVAFISILATLFGMNWASSIRRNAIDTTLTQFTRTLSSGRTEAIQRSQPIRLAALTCANGGACDWQKGWRLETITPSAELSRVAELHGALNITLMQPPTGSQTECQALSTPEVMRRIEFRPTGRVWFFKTTDDATRLSLSSICLRFGVGSDFTDLLISRMGSTEVLK
jgi:Tfp pilus assembly protein FimT